MNIFILDNSLVRSAQLLCDQHLNKQILELAQILSTLGYGPYRPTHKNHPVTKWAGNNLRFCFQYLEILALEWKNRSGKLHKSYLDIIKFKDTIPVDYVDTKEQFPIRNDLDLIKEKYAEWTSRAKPLIPKHTQYKINFS